MLSDEFTLQIENLHVRIETKNGEVRGVDGVSFGIRQGEMFGLAGESGSGKSMTASAILRLLPPHGRIVDGEIRFDGKDLAALSDEAVRKIRGNRIAMIFQDPMSSLNPVFTVGSQIQEAILQHRSMSRKEAREEAVRLLTMVEIPSSRKRYHAYPHEFSGGMRQRVMIAMALACSPELLIADEPTTALDVTVEKQVLALLHDLQNKTGTAILLITHNLSLIAEHCSRIAVMYAGQIVEMGLTKQIFDNPLHPYTRALLGAVPRQHISQGRLGSLAGNPPIITGEGRGCRFAPRCLARMANCEDVDPPFTAQQGEHSVRCLLYDNAHDRTVAYAE